VGSSRGWRCLVDEPRFLPATVEPQVGQGVPGPESLPVSKEEDGRAPSGELLVGEEEVPYPFGTRGHREHAEVPDAEVCRMEPLSPGFRIGEELAVYGGVVEAPIARAPARILPPSEGAPGCGARKNRLWQTPEGQWGALEG
jgi:hypothetical protein